MAQAVFSDQGVTLTLSKEEWWFVNSAMSYVLHGRRLPDHDFRNVLMADPGQAERLFEQLSDAEAHARSVGSHWNPHLAE